jgi:hypothetical protein
MPSVSIEKHSRRTGGYAEKITHQQALSDYGIRVLQVNDLISSIKTIRRDLNAFILNPGKDPEPMRQALISR